MDCFPCFRLVDPTVAFSSPRGEPLSFQACETNSSTVVERTILAAGRVLAAIGAVASGVLFLSTGSLLLGAVAIGLTVVTICIWPNSETPTHRVATSYLHTNPVFSVLPPPAERLPSPPLLAFPRAATPYTSRPHGSIFAERASSPLRDPFEERVVPGDHSSLFMQRAPELREPSPRLRMVTMERPHWPPIPIFPSEPDERIGVGDRASVVEEAERGDERVPVRRK